METEAPPPEEKQSSGAPAWMATFADLATLLMSFFVLILSFSELDVLKYKQIAGSMSEAFGVQRDLKTRDPPRGLNIIAKEFSAASPEDTRRNVVKQDTTNTHKKFVRIKDEHQAKPTVENNKKAKRAGDKGSEQPEQASDKGSGQPERTEDNAQKVDPEAVKAALKSEIDRGLVEVSTEDRKVVIRIRERGSFPSGNADLKVRFKPVLWKIRDVLASINGNVVVAGHSDDIPIATARYRSNWDLSSARAASVVQELLRGDKLDAKRFQVTGYADTKPIDSNSTGAGRARNRRVELKIVQGTDRTGEPVSVGGDAGAEEAGTESADTVDLLEANNSVLMELLSGFRGDDSDGGDSSGAGDGEGTKGLFESNSNLLKELLGSFGSDNDDRNQ